MRKGGKEVIMAKAASRGKESLGQSLAMYPAAGKNKGAGVESGAFLPPGLELK
jgi:hypothetical protein